MLQKHHFSDIQTSEEASEGTSEAKFGGRAKFRIAIKCISGFITDDRILFFQTSDQTSDQTSEATSEVRSNLRPKLRPILEARAEDLLSESNLGGCLRGTGYFR